MYNRRLSNLLSSVSELKLSDTDTPALDYDNPPNHHKHAPNEENNRECHVQSPLLHEANEKFLPPVVPCPPVSQEEAKSASLSALPKQKVPAPELTPRNKSVEMRTATATAVMGDATEADTDEGLSGKLLSY